MANGPYAGEYDPVIAGFRSPVRGQSSEGEPTLSFPSNTLTRYIRFVKQWGQELQAGLQLHSANSVVIRCRRDTATEGINASWRIHHRSIVYNITAVNPIDYRSDEVEFVCQSESPTS